MKQMNSDSLEYDSFKCVEYCGTIGSFRILEILNLEQINSIHLKNICNSHFE